MAANPIRSTCGYCSTGCRLTVEPDSKKVWPDVGYPVNRGMACPKGFLFLEPLKAADRAAGPYIRDAAGRLVPTDWDTAMRAFTDHFKRIQARHGQDAVAFLGTGQLPTEEAAFLGALGKFGLGMTHGDGNTRQCMATAVQAYKRAFGFDAPPFTYQDLEEADVLVFVGANPVIAHPILWNRVKKNANAPQIVVIDPRRTETAQRATRHYPIRPDALLTFLYGIAHLLIQNNWIDRGYIERHTTGFDPFRSHVQRFDAPTVAGRCGIPESDLRALAETIYNGRRVSFWWTMGVNQNYQAVACAQAVINLALMTGNIGRPGTGANSITGQANAMGSRLFSNTTNLLGGHDFGDADHRRKIAGILGIDPARVPERNSLAYDQILQEIEAGRIRGLWIVCTNPSHSWIDKPRLFRILKNLEYFVVQDMFLSTETAQMADLVLAAAGCGEKEGTFINSERRVGVIRQVTEPPGSALPDFEIFRRIADAWGCGAMFRDWSSPAAAFELLKKASRGQPCDISGIGDYDRIEAAGGIQWPCPAGAPDPGRERRLFEDGRYFHADGRARFLFDAVGPVPEEVDDEFPFVLLTGRGTVAQWHTQTRTGKVEKLRKMHPAEAYVEVHAADAAALGIQTNDRVRVGSRRGAVMVRAAVGETVARGALFMPMHYAETNFLTYAAFDPVSREPSYKYAAVSLHPA